VQTKKSIFHKHKCPTKADEAHSFKPSKWEVLYKAKYEELDSSPSKAPKKRRKEHEKQQAANCKCKHLG
jgi:hypothetical protein